MEKEHNKDYSLWHEKKKVLDEKEISRTFFYHEREVWWTAVGVNVGVEIDGKSQDFERPVLVVKSSIRTNSLDSLLLPRINRVGTTLRLIF